MPSTGVSSTPSVRRIVEYSGPLRGDVMLFANAGVDADVAMALYMRAVDDDAVSIVFGTERFRLEFFDVESLKRLRDLAEEGARRLRVALELTARAESTKDDWATDRVEPVAAGVAR